MAEMCEYFTIFERKSQFLIVWMVAFISHCNFLPQGTTHLSSLSLKFVHLKMCGYGFLD